MMDGVSIQNMPVLIVAGDEEVRDKVRSFFLISEQSNLRIDTSESYTEALSRFLSSGDVYGVVIVVCEDLDPDFENFVGAVQHNENGPLVIITDDKATTDACKAMSVRFVIPETGMSAPQVTNIIPAAWDNYRLNQSLNRMEDHYHLAEQRFRDVADNFSDWVWEIDVSMNLIFSSSRKRPVKEAQVGTRFASCFLPDEQRRIEDDFAELARSPKPFHEMEYWSFDAYGARVCWTVSGVPVFDKAGELVGFRGMAKDISSSKASVDQLYYLSNNDPLTGLYNRNRFFEEVKRAVRGFKRNGEEGAVAVFDLDKFKYVNDTHGHELADRVLVHIAQVLKDNVRSGDFVARTGGDEFAVILHDVTSENTRSRVESLMKAVSNSPYKQDNNMFTVTASAGVVRYPDDGRTADELMSRADITLNHSKQLGRNRLEMYGEHELKKQDVSRRLDWLEFITRCLDDQQNRMLLHFQPIVSLSNENEPFRFYEVLIRMIDDDGNLVTPFKFIETAEEFGLVSKIDRFVTRKAVTLLRKWQDQGRDMKLTVNISSRTFDDEAAMEDIKTTLASAELEPGRIVFEITETSVLRDLHRVKEVMEEMKKLGAHFALDDCGVGYSSLNYIKQLDFEYIKIDGSFVRDLHNSAEDDALVRALRDVAKRLKILTVAEMVEEPETVDHLKRLGIDFGQGYHFGMPSAELSEDDMEEGFDENSQDSVVTKFPSM